MGQKKSKTKNNNLNPVYNETFQFIIPEITDHVLHMSVKDSDIGKDAMLGKCDINLWEIEGLGETDTPIEISKILDHGRIYVTILYKED